jgi:hypothetical protein
MGSISVYDTGMENFNYTLTESEDMVLTEMVQFFLDLDHPDGFDQDAFDSLVQKVLA